MIQEITCEYIKTARPIDRATVAEMLTNSLHRVLRCDKCEKYHVWVEVSRLEWTGGAAARNRITADYYTQVGPNSYLHKGYRKIKKKVKGGDDDQDED